MQESNALAVAVPDQDVEYIPDGHHEDFPYYRLMPDGSRVEITRSEYKQAMKEEFTVKNPRNPTCGHKIVVGKEPRHRNCDSCWFAFFQVHGEITKLADTIFQEHGAYEAEKIISEIKGRKFFKNFTRFMSTVAVFKAGIESAKEQDGSTGRPESVDSEAGDAASLQGGGTEESS